eukprot:g16292.t1
MEEEGPSPDVLRAAALLLKEPDAVDKGIATFMLISGTVFFVVSSVAMVLFFRERNSFEIRARFIDDLFGIGPELRVMVFVQAVIFVTGRLAEEYAEPDLLRWINSERVGFLGAMFMISISIIYPIWRRLVHPLQSTDPKVVEALARRRALGVRKRASIGPTSASGTDTFTTDPDDVSFFSTSTSSPTPQSLSAGSSPGSWTYERVVMIPETATALEQFSRKALCQESFLFLRDAAAYQAQGFGEIEAGHVDVGKGTDGSGGGINGDENSEAQSSGDGAGEGSSEQFKLFSKIVQEYIVDGAPNEINISWDDRNDILDVYRSTTRGKSGFNELPVLERRLVFARAFAEVRYVLESNLMRKFIGTDEFAKSLAASRQRQALG